jgi:tetratricopeptide (TPR) repeat protein
MNGFLELESLESLKSRLLETGTWFEIFEQLAEHALHMDALGNGTEAEVFYHQCKLYLEQASEGDEHVAGSLSSTIALFWVYLALANLHRYSHIPDYSKAIEYLQLLLSTRAKIASSSEGVVAPSYNEIRFALCLTMFEWVDGPKEFDQAAGKAVLNAVPLREEARDIVDEWKTLDDVEVSSSLAYMLSLGYAKLQRNDRKSYWDQWLTDLKMQYVVTGDPMLDKIPKYPSVEFQRFSKKTKFCLHRFREFGVKAKTARAAGQILAAEQCYGRCLAVVRAASDEYPPLARIKNLGWAYENLARIYRLDLVDHMKAIECYRASLREAEAIQAHTDLGSTIKALKSSIVEVMYERAYDVDFSLDKERETRLIAEAVLEARKFFPEVYNGSVSDLDLKGFICWHLSKQYEDWGRNGEALFWNEKRLELLEADKKKPLYNYVLLRSIAMLLHLGEDEKARKMIPDVMKKLKKNALDQGSPDAIRALATLPYTSHLKREMFRQTMTADVNEDEYNAEVKWAEQFLQKFEPHDADTKHERPDEITKWNLLCLKGKQLMSEDKLEEAVACFHQCLELISEDGSDAMYYTMECHGLIGECHSILFLRAVQRELQFGVGAYPGNDETLPFMYHFRESMDNLQKALKVAEQREDIYNMANYNKMLGFLLYTNWRLVLPPHAKLSKDGYACLRTALNHHKASGRNLNRLLYGLRDTNALWISVLERHDNVSIGTYYVIQRSIYEIIRLEYINNQMTVTPEFIQNSILWGSQALLWAERGHSRSLAFKLTERNMGRSTRSELQRFDMDDWGEAFTSIKESRDVSGPGTVMLEFIKTDGEDKEKFIIYAVTQVCPKYNLFEATGNLSCAGIECH